MYSSEAQGTRVEEEGSGSPNDSPPIPTVPILRVAPSRCNLNRPGPQEAWNGLVTLALAPISAVTEAEVPGIIGRMEARLQARRLPPHVEGVWWAT